MHAIVRRGLNGKRKLYSDIDYHPPGKMAFIFLRAINKDFSMIRLYIEVSFAIGASPLTVCHSARQATNAQGDFLSFNGFAGTLMKYFDRNHCSTYTPNPFVVKNDL